VAGTLYDVQKIVETFHECDMPMPVAMECLGRSARGRVAETPIEILVPTLTREAVDDRPIIDSPNFSVLPRDRDRWTRFFQNDQVHPFTGSPWGHVHMWDHAEAFSAQVIQRFGIRFTVDARDVQLAFERVAGQIEQWWSDLQAWIEVLTSIDVSTRSGGRGSVSAGAAWTNSEEGDSLVQLSPREIRITARGEPEHGISLPSLTQAAELAAAVEIPLEWQLVREARHRRWEGRWRACVLDAGTAAELALARLTGALLGDTPAAAQAALLDGYRTLGGRASLYRRLGGELPANFTADVVRPRNAATHEGEQLDASTAARAESTVSDLVHRAVPLDALHPED